METKRKRLAGKAIAWFLIAFICMAGVAVWGVINLLEGYGNDNRATRS